MGKAKAATQAGKPELATEARTALSDQWTNADAPVRNRLESLSTVQTSAASNSK
jgi:hypothetical protein